MPIYNQDGDENPPAEWTAFRERIRAADAVLFVTPEHNRSVPAALKNALDIGSRPYGKSAWSGKPGAVVSASPGAIGGFGANHHLRQSLVFLNVPAMAQPEAYIGGADKLFDATGKLINDGTRKFLRASCSPMPPGSARITKHRTRKSAPALRNPCGHRNLKMAVSGCASRRAASPRPPSAWRRCKSRAGAGA